MAELEPGPLHLACKNGHYQTVETLLNHGYNVNGTDDDGFTPLMLACEYGHTDIAILLLSRGAQVNMQDNHGWSALMIASHNGHSDVVKVLIEKGAQVNMQTNDGRSALMIASQHGHSDVVKVLIEKGAQVNMQDNDGRSALMIASQYGHSDVVKVLIEKGAQVNMQDNDGRSALMIASQYGHSDVVKVLIEKGAEVNMQHNNGWSALMIASQTGHSDVVKILIEKGAQVNMQTNDGRSALMIASQYGHSDVVKVLIEKGAEVNMQHNNGWSALMIASQTGHSDVVKILIEKGAQVNMQTNDGRSALMLACYNGHSDVVKVLIEKGAEVNMQHNNGWSALMIASQNGHSDVVKVLIEKGAQVNMQNNNGFSALMIASQNGHSDVVKVFIEKGAQVNMQDNDGWSALMLACYNGRKEVAQILLDHHADKNIRDRNGKNALSLASEAGCTEMVELLLPYEHRDTTSSSTSTEEPPAKRVKIKKGEDDISLSKEVEAVTNTDALPTQDVQITASPSKQVNNHIKLKSPELSLKVLSMELKTVTDPIQLGVCLGVKQHHLEKIRKNNPQDIRQQQFDLFSFIAKNYMVLGITWERIADALEELVGMGDLAQDVRSKYNIVKPQTVTEGLPANRVTLQELVRRHSLTDEQLNSEIVGSDIPYVAKYFDGVIIYSSAMGLTPSELADVKDLSYRKGIQVAMTECLILWKRHDPVTATHKALLELLLKLRKEEIADQICQHLTKLANKERISEGLFIFRNKPIGSGAFGTVFRGELDGGCCAVKVLRLVADEIQLQLPTASLASTDSVERFRKECEFFESFQHPNIVRHLATKEYPKTNHLVLALELMDCNLRQYFIPQADKEPIKLSLAIQTSLCHDIASALEYIHSRGVVHRDLCGENILLSCGGETPVAKVCDFGMSKITKNDTQSVSLQAFAHKGYMPPEATDMESSSYNSKFDIFSFGALMVQIVRHLPTIKDGKYRKYELKLIEDAHPIKELIIDCLNENRDDRPLAAQLKRRLV
ncbi:ankyrin repeat domain-containing protein 50-like isoform X2 [Halichondria panicea]|uniref:ankyrin repeat domain-containing protein 50-like isoform X2 n=1 Tax=Halichondria panicea TaxID=6063 RepID=UPI00312B4216